MRRAVARAQRGLLRLAARLAWWRDRRRRRGRPQVVLIGDSITRFWLDADPGFFLAQHIVNAGISGETSAAMLARFARDVVALRPRLVHILAGTNDLWHGDPGDAAGAALANIAAMTALAEAAGIVALVALPPPISAEAARLFARPELHAPLCAGIVAHCRRQGLAYVDYAGVLTRGDGRWIAAFTTDGVHLTRRGYLAMRGRARRAIRAGLAAPHPAARATKSG